MSHELPVPGEALAAGATLAGDAEGRQPPRREYGGEAGMVLPFDGGPAEQALRTHAVQVLAPGDSAAAGMPVARWTVLAPVTERGESLGLLELSLPERPGPAVLGEVARTAHLLAFVVIANRRHTDLFEWGQRTHRFSLSAEIQRRLLPAAFTCEGGSFTLSAWLEPAAAVGGDTFDYSLGRDELHLSVTDAMGHGVASALTATLCVGALRNARRAGSTLLEQATAANSALMQNQTSAAGEGFATGLLARLDLPTGRLRLVNAGHVPPFLARAGDVTRLSLRPGLPLGLFPDATYETEELLLRPGDRLVLVTDGMLERSAAALDLPAAIRDTALLHPRETTRYLADRVLSATETSLADDATLLVLDWHAGHGQPRTTTAGADPT